ncbi:hypothetical protein Pcinc_001320 [Petrolisthes cinctipes]|uniref:Uncharacterized protein n=1 Tax=Petrolisthes cinctipes TaxID=88211 RepID=A0AAE1GLU8_PETCI|nr:hypothetical protein Pcinc_001320 [Petrolisthes cinctipes]
MKRRKLDSITAIASSASGTSPANGMSPLEMMAPQACPAHLAPASSHVINGPVYGTMQHQHAAMQHATLQHSALQHTVNFGLPPPPPPPPLGNAKLHNGKLPKHIRRRERAILIDRVSRILFPASFTVLNVIYWSVFVVEWF